MLTEAKQKHRTAAPAAQIDSAHPSQPAEPFGLRALWLHFANEVELRRLAKLHTRIERKQAALADLVSERQRIMNRCIRRMRRASGKN